MQPLNISKSRLKIDPVLCQVSFKVHKNDFPQTPIVFILLNQLYINSVCALGTHLYFKSHFIMFFYFFFQ